MIVKPNSLVIALGKTGQEGCVARWNQHNYDQGEEIFIRRYNWVEIILIITV